MKRFIVTSLLLVCIFMLLPMTADAKSSMSRLNRMRLVVGRELLEMNAENWQSLLPYYTHDIEYHEPSVDVYGIDVMTEFLYRLIFISSPDLVTTVEEEICIDDMYAANWLVEGPFNGSPYSAKGMTVMKFHPRSKMVYYQRDHYSEGDIMINIPPAGRTDRGVQDILQVRRGPDVHLPAGAAALRRCLRGESASV